MEEINHSAEAAGGLKGGDSKMAFLPGPIIRMPKGIEEELINFGETRDIPRKEKRGTIRAIKIKKGLRFSIAGKIYEVVKIVGSTVLCRYRGEANASE